MLTPKSATARNWRASMAQDVAKGRTTEIEYMNGHVVAQGKAAGVPTPVSVATVEMIRELEAGQRKQAPENITEVLKRAGV
jgi:2-dehydropantoate 2-reductase